MVFKGRTLDEAIRVAEDSLGGAIEKYVYSVTEKKIGIFKKEFEIKIDIIEEEAYGEIKNGEFIFHKGKGKILIEVVDNVKIKINGEIILKDTYIGEDDIVEFDQVRVKGSKKININLVEENFKAILEVTTKPPILYHITDHNKSQTINVRVEPEILGKEQEVTIDEIKEELVKKGIVFGINLGAVDKILHEKQGIIAVGKKEIEPINDKIVYFFSVDNERRPVEINGKVDYYSIEEIESVEKDSILAIIEDGRNGENGVDILGKVIQVKPKKVVALKVGPGAYLTEDRKSVKAQTSGRPIIIGDKISVLPTVQINGDADMKIGNIEFDGDIFISKDVREGMKISAGGSIKIGGSVLEASIHSRSDVTIRNNLIASTVKAGNIELNEIKYIQELQDIYIFLGEFIELTEQFHKMMGEKSVGVPKSAIAKKIIDSKFNDKKLKLKSIKKGYCGLKMCKNMTELFDTFFMLYEKILDGKSIDFNKITDIHLEIGKFLEVYNVTKTSADVYMSYSQNSKIYSSRNVYIKGKGCYSTDIEAEGKVYIEGNPGTFRSGTIYAKEGVRIKEIGSSAGVKSIIKTGESGEIEAETIYHNTLLIIGKLNYYVDEAITKVKVYLKDGELKVDKFKL